MHLFLNLTLILALSFSTALAEPYRLQVSYQNSPMGIENPQPAFSWQMKPESGKRNQHQTAYQIKVRDESGNLVWDSGETDSDISVGIRYNGQELRPTHRYEWELIVWDQDGVHSTQKSFFETGLMNTDPGAWGGATWIGGGEQDLVFYSHSLSVFKSRVSIQLDKAANSKKAAFLLGGNDYRLMDQNLNLLGMANKKDESYVAFELDISELEEAQAQLNIYRVGYHRNDQANTPFHTLEIPKTLIHQDNQYDPHSLYLECNLGIFAIYINGQEAENKISPMDPSKPVFVAQGINLNPMGEGGNYLSFPMVGDIGFKVAAGQKAIFSDLEISNHRSPSNALYVGASSGEKTFSKDVHPDLAAKNGQFHVGSEEKEVLVLANPSQKGSPMLRTTFETASKTIRKARIYATARGIYEMYLNGERIGADYFNPGLTQYNKNHQYQVYDVTEKIEMDKTHAWGAWLSEGWWSGHITFSGQNWNFFGDRQSLLAKLVIDYEDGSQQVVDTSPDNWKIFHEGPLLYGSFFQGEVYDARREADIEGWALPQFDDQGWSPAREVRLKGNTYIGPMTNGVLDYNDFKLSAQNDPSPKVVKTLEAQEVQEVRPGVFVYDMGQNMVGFPKVSLPSGQAGDTILMRFAEVKYPELEEYGDNVGMIMMENIRAALTHDYYIRKGGRETIQPRFTFHGYRFVEITGIKRALPLSAVQGMVVSSVGQLASHYETSNELVNTLWENITWSMRGNFLSIPTDTPARNERMGWSGDINVFAKTSTYLADALPFLKKHMMSMRDMQAENGKFADVAPVGNGFGGTLWGSAGIIIPWELYRQYGDNRILEDNYEAMKAYVHFLDIRTDPETGILLEGPLGDWLSPEVNKNDNTMFWTAYQVYCLKIMAQVATALGLNEDVASFTAQFNDRSDFLHETYFDASTGKSIHSGYHAPSMGPPGEGGPQNLPKKGDLVDTQATYAIPLGLGLIKEDIRPQVVVNLAESVMRSNTDDGGTTRPPYSLMTGFIATASISEALSMNGHPELAYRLLQQTSYPSWLYSVINGATTIWERLNSYTVEDGFGGNNSMNSFNHYSFGAVGGWMYNHSLGIQRHPNIPAFKQFVLRPQPDPDKEMKWAKGHYDSVHGRIESEWSWGEDHWNYKATVPPNTSALLLLPADSNINEGGEALESVMDIEILQTEGGSHYLKLNSGTYDFRIGQLP